MSLSKKTRLYRKPKFEVADVFRQNLHLLEHASYEQWKVVNAIIHCRTSRLGGHKTVCGDCGHEEISYNSCRNRHCPKCQTGKRIQWVERQAQDLLPVPYFHIVFTVPDVLKPLILQNKRELYEILFQAASRTLKEAALNPKNLGAHIGFIAILHTWGQNLLNHPHLHCVVTGGGLSPDKSTWINGRNDFFIAINILNRLFRGKFLWFLKKAYQAGRLGFHGKTQSAGVGRVFDELLAACYSKKWVVYCKKPFNTPLNVLKYLGRYTHRVAIGNRRIVSVADGNVKFVWTDYRDGSRKKVMALTTIEFMRRFLLHVLPHGFKRIRFYGILSNGRRRKNLKLIRKLAGIQENKPIDPNTRLFSLGDLPERKCSRCKSKNIQTVEILPENGASEYWSSA